MRYHKQGDVDTVVVSVLFKPLPTVAEAMAKSYPLDSVERANVKKYYGAKALAFKRGFNEELSKADTDISDDMRSLFLTHVRPLARSDDVQYLMLGSFDSFTRERVVSHPAALALVYTL